MRHKIQSSESWELFKQLSDVPEQMLEELVKLGWHAAQSESSPVETKQWTIWVQTPDEKLNEDVNWVQSESNPVEAKQ